MREIQHAQMKLGEVAVSQIQLDTKSRDEIPKSLMGLQYIYCTPEIRAQAVGSAPSCVFNFGRDHAKGEKQEGRQTWNGFMEYFGVGDDTTQL